MVYSVYNVGFIDKNKLSHEIQLDVEESDIGNEEVIELINLILSLKDEMEMLEIEYIEYVGQEKEEDYL